MSIWDRVGDAFKAGAKAAADTALAPPPSAAPVATPYTPTGINTPTPSSLPSWAIPAAIGGVVLLLVMRK